MFTHVPQRTFSCQKSGESTCTNLAVRFEKEINYVAALICIDSTKNDDGKN